MERFLFALRLSFVLPIFIFYPALALNFSIKNNTNEQIKVLIKSKYSYGLSTNLYSTTEAEPAGEVELIEIETKTLTIDSNKSQEVFLNDKSSISEMSLRSISFIVETKESKKCKRAYIKLGKISIERILKALGDKPLKVFIEKKDDNYLLKDNINKRNILKMEEKV